MTYEKTLCFSEGISAAKSEKRSTTTSLLPAMQLPPPRYEERPVASDSSHHPPYYSTIKQEAERWSAELRAISLEIHGELVSPRLPMPISLTRIVLEQTTPS